jgi:class 3 adenylate cyclase
MNTRDTPRAESGGTVRPRVNGHDATAAPHVVCRCGFESPAALTFCGSCGARLGATTCGACGAENPHGYQFCGHCGAALAAGASQAESRVAEAERRHMTVVFCDLVGSTALSEQLDPEALHDLVRRYQGVCCRATARFDGHVGQYLGDGVLLYFGYPRAHEDDAQRAVRAGLAILEEMRELNAELQREGAPRVAVRIGVHSGLVVVGEIGAPGDRGPVGIVGETPNVAARLQALAAPDSLVMSEATHALVRGFFAVDDPRAETLKGISVPVRTYRVLGESGAWSRFEIQAAGGLTRLVGREEETRLLLDRWRLVKEGVGQVVLVGGEAGIGKSRLVSVLRERLADEPHTWLECFASPHHTNSALFPVIGLVQRLLGSNRDVPAAERLARLEEVLAGFPVPTAEAVPLFADLLSLPYEHRHPSLEMTPQRRRQRTLEIVLTMLLRLTAERPLVLFVDDLHWVDPSTHELLGLCIDQGPTARILMLLTCRPEFTPSWVTRSHVTHLTLDRLAPADAERMVASLAGGRALPPEVVRQVVGKTDGVPLFVEELTKMVLESGLLHDLDGRLELIRPLPPLAIPTTLHDSLIARLDRLSPVRDVAQLGATLGREFGYELLHALSPLPEEELVRELGRLVESELLYQRGVPPAATYVFKHALIRDAAYESMLRAKRREVHRRIAGALVEQFPALAETEPEVVAHHWTEGGEPARAVLYWQLAALRATQRSAHEESLAFTRRGLALLAELPEGPDRLQRELLLHTTSAVPLIALRGYAAPETEATSPSCAASGSSTWCAGSRRTRTGSPSSSSSWRTTRATTAICSRRTSRSGRRPSSSATSSPRSTTWTRRSPATTPPSTGATPGSTARTPAWSRAATPRGRCGIAAGPIARSVS